MDNCFEIDNGSFCKLTVDDTDCPIQEPSPFSPKWYSHKFKSAGLRYEVAVSLQKGDICWVNGPFPCGSHPDIKIARLGLVQELRLNEMCIADSGYRGDECFKTPTGFNTNSQRMQSVARSRHETVNSRFKKFKILSDKYRGKLDKHNYVFMAIAVLTQVEIDSGNKLFQIDYNDTEFERYA